MKALTNATQPGDLFYIPAMDKQGEYGFVIARYIETVSYNVGYLIEVFSKFYSTPPASISEVDMHERLFRPVMFDRYFDLIPRWKILFSDPSYDKSQSNYENITIAFWEYLWIGGKSKIPPAYKGQLEEFEDSTCWATYHLVFRVNAHLQGIFGPNDPYDYHKLPKEIRIENPAAQEIVEELAIEMDKRFTVWAAESKKKSKKVKDKTVAS